MFHTGIRCRMTYISRMQRVVLFILVILVLGCKKEPTSWNTSNSGPLIKTTLGIHDLIADSLLSIGEDDLVSIVYSNELINYGVDSLVEVEDDTIANSFSIFPVSELQVNSGQQFFNQSEVLSFEQVDAALRRALIGEGSLKLNAQSDIDGDILFRVVIPNAIRNGVSFEYEAIIPSGTSNTPGILDDTADLSGYDLDLTGVSGNTYSEIEVLYSLTVPGYEEQVTVFSFNEVLMEITFDGLELEFVEGFLGSEEIEFNDKAYFESVPELNQAIINLDEASLNLSLVNGFGVDLQTVLFSVKAENSATGNQVDLNHSIIGSSINLNRAALHQGIPDPSERSFLIDHTNSNVLDFLEVIPDSLSVTGRVELNPFGNISNYNDFASAQSTFKCIAALEIPLRTSFSNLILRDSSTIDWSEENQIQKTIFYLHSKSTFKANATIDLRVVDGSGNVLINLSDYILDGLPPIIPGADGSGQETHTLAFELGEAEMETLSQADQIITELRFETTNYPDLVEIRSTDSIDLLISADVNAQLEF